MITISKDSVIKNSLSGSLLFMWAIAGIVLVMLPVPIYLKIGILLFITMIVAFFMNPFFATMVFMFIRPAIQPLIDDQVINGVPLVGIFPLWITFFLLFKFLTDKTYTVAIPHLGYLLFLLPLSIFSMFNSVSVIESLAYLLRLIGWISIYILIFNLVKTRQDAKKVMVVLILSALIPSIVGYYQLFTHTGHIDVLRRLNRVTSVFSGQANAAAIYFSVIIFVILAFYTQTKSLFTKRTLYPALASILVLIIFTYHRSSQIGLLAGVIAISVFNKKMIKVAIPLFLLVGVVFHGEIEKRIIELFVTPKYGVSSLTTRTDLWQIVIFKVIPEHPFVGWGVGLADIAIGKFSYFALIPHNDYLRLAAEIGIFGMLLYVAFLFFEVRYYFRKIITNTNRDLNAIVLGLLVYFVIVSFVQNNVYNVTTMAVLFSMLAISKKLNSLKEESPTSRENSSLE